MARLYIYEKGKSAAKEFEGKKDENDGNYNNNDDFGIDSGDDYVSHNTYRDIVAESFEKRSPSRLASNKPAYFSIVDPATRTLTASKYSAKVQ